MTFLYPNFLYALFLLIIPIIIHLFNFRSYKTVYFSNVEFLKNITLQSKSKSKVKHIIVLILRMLVFAMLVLAFAQPIIPTSDTQKASKNRVGIYIDNSFSTEANSKYGKLSEIAKNTARDIIEAYGHDAEFIFLDNDFSSKHQHFVSQEQIKDFVAETQITPRVKTINQSISKLKSFLLDENYQNFENNLYVISDFQKNISNFSKLENDSVKVNFIPLEAEMKNNLYIDSAWFETPNRQYKQADELFVKITNKSDEAYNNIPLKLFLNDTLKTPAGFNVEANSSTTVKLIFTNTNKGIINGKLEISDYPVTFDNTFFFNYTIDNQKDILVIGKKDKNIYIDAVFKNNSFFKLKHFSESNIKTSEISNFDVVFIDGIKSFSSGLIQELVNFTSNGGTLIIFPAKDLNIESYNKIFNKFNTNYIVAEDTTKIFMGAINYKASVLQNIFKKEEKNPDLPFFTQRVKFSNMTHSNEENILFAENNDKILSKASFGKGMVYIFSAEANKNSGNFVFHPLWAPILYNMSVFGNDISKISYTIGKDKTVSLNKVKKKVEQVVHIQSLNGDFDFIPQSAGKENTFYLSGDVKFAGNYVAKIDEKSFSGLALNYDRKESDIAQFSNEEISQFIEENNLYNYKIITETKSLLKKTIQENNAGKQLWKYIIWFALIFLLLEITIIRLFK